MDIRVYKNDEFIFTVDDPARLANLIPVEEHDEFALDADDLAAWQGAVRVQAVRDEAQRRIMLLLGARNIEHMNILISNGSREAIRLLRKGSDNWTSEETVRAAELDKLDAAIEIIRTASNALGAMEPVPESYVDDKWWILK